MSQQCGVRGVTRQACRYNDTLSSHWCWCYDAIYPLQVVARLKTALQAAHEQAGGGGGGAVSVST
jgi:hypothetical protein